VCQDGCSATDVISYRYEVFFSNEINLKANSIWNKLNADVDLILGNYWLDILKLKF
jgi:hypothetical protein